MATHWATIRAPSWRRADDHVPEGEFEEYGEPEYADGAEEGDEPESSEFDDFKKMVSDIFNENPKLAFGLLMLLIVFLLDFCS